MLEAVIYGIGGLAAGLALRWIRGSRLGWLKIPPLAVIALLVGLAGFKGTGPAGLVLIVCMFIGLMVPRPWYATKAGH